MKVVFDKEKLGEIVRHVERDIDLAEVKLHAMTVAELFRANPFDNPREFKAFARHSAASVLAILASIDKAGEILKLADPDTDIGELKLEAAVRILDDAIEFKGIMGILAERFDDNVIRFALMELVEMLNGLIGHDWADKVEKMATA